MYSLPGLCCSPAGSTYSLHQFPAPFFTSSKPLSGLLLSIFRICSIVFGEVSMPLPSRPTVVLPFRGGAFSFWDLLCTIFACGKLFLWVRKERLHPPPRGPGEEDCSPHRAPSLYFQHQISSLACTSFSPPVITPTEGSSLRLEYGWLTP